MYEYVCVCIPREKGNLPSAAVFHLTSLKIIRTEAILCIRYDNLIRFKFYLLRQRRVVGMCLLPPASLRLLADPEGLGPRRYVNILRKGSAVR
jgi:hypothetical protein